MSERFRRRSREASAGLAILCCALAAPPAAPAQEPGFESPSVDQYVESVPTGRGPVPATGGDRRRASLPAPARRAIREQGGADADDLAALATAPSLGAPTEAAEGRRGATRRKRGGKRAGKPSRDAVEADPSATRLKAPQRSAVAAFTGAAGDGAAIWVLLAAVAGSAGLIVAARRRRPGDD